MQLNFYGFNKLNKSKVYTLPDGNVGWKDEYKLKHPISINIHLKEGYNYGYLSIAVPLMMFSNVYRPDIISVSGLNVINKVFNNHEYKDTHPYAKYDSRTGALTIFNSDEELQSDDDVYYWDILDIDTTTNNWPWNTLGLSTRIKSVSFAEPVICDVAYMFDGMTNLSRIDNINYLVGTFINNTSCMFRNCSSLKQLDLSYFDTSLVQNMSSMFEGCSNLETLKISTMNFRYANNVDNMFKNCSKLKTNIIFSYKHSINMNSMFTGCATALGSSVFTYFDNTYTSADIRAFNEYINEFWSSSNISAVGHKDPIPVKRETYSSTLIDLLKTGEIRSGALEVVMLPGETLHIENISSGVMIEDLFHCPVANYIIDSVSIKDSKFRTMLTFIENSAQVAYICDQGVCISEDLNLELDVHPRRRQGSISTSPVSAVS